MRRHRKRENESKSYPMKMNGARAVMACRILFSFVSQKGQLAPGCREGECQWASLFACPLGFGQSVELVVKSGTGEVLSLTRILLHDELSPPQAIWA